MKTSNSFDAFLSDYRTLNQSNLDLDQQTYLFSNIAKILKQTLPSNSIFPDSKTDEKLLSESISYPVFTLFRTMHQHEEKCRKSYQTLLADLHERLPTVGYMLLYFLKVHAKLQSRKNSNQNQYKATVYKQLCDAIDDKLDKCLAHDLELLENENTQIFLWLLPDIYREFKPNVINNSEIIKIILSCIDAKNLRDLIYSVTQGKLVLFKNDGLIDCVRQSLCYETFEQFCLWQLVQAHDVPIEFLQVSALTCNPNYFSHPFIDFSYEFFRTYCQN